MNLYRYPYTTKKIHWVSITNHNTFHSCTFYNILHLMHNGIKFPMEPNSLFNILMWPSVWVMIDYSHECKYVSGHESGVGHLTGTYNDIAYVPICSILSDLYVEENHRTMHAECCSKLIVFHLPLQLFDRWAPKFSNHVFNTMFLSELPYPRS